MTPERKLIWEHNSFSGHARMTQVNMDRIINSKTATVRAKMIASEIYSLTFDLHAALKERVK